jgi:antitoxin ParD1/3/4
MSMNVSLTSELEKYIQKQVASQRYQTASEVVRQALRLMQNADEFDKARLDALRQDIQVGLNALDRGEYVTIRNEKDQQALFNRITREGRARLAAKLKRRSA